jgi:tRNA uridine 5-carboxymethylaminomethyl modification enzyme
LRSEIDALDGVMGRIADKAGIHFRVLNETKGPAVQGPRCQADRELYKSNMLQFMQNQPHLTIREGSVEDLMLSESKKDVCGVRLGDGSEITSKTVILTTGTFLSGMIHIGDERIPAGRIGDAPSTGLAATLKQTGFAVDRLKTGTPPRLNATTIDFTKMEKGASDDPPVPFSFLHTPDDLIKKPVTCHLTWTTNDTIKIIHDHLHQLPKFESGAGKVGGLGPRYCPSIETKVMRFPDRNHHVREITDL